MIRGNEADNNNAPHAQQPQVPLQGQAPVQPMQGKPRVAGASANVLAANPTTITTQPTTFQQYMIPGQIITSNSSGQPSVRTMVAVTQTQAVHNYVLATSPSCIQGHTSPVATICTTIGQPAISAGTSSVQLAEGVPTTLLNVPVVTTQVQQVQVQMPLAGGVSLQEPLLRTQMAAVCAASTVATSSVTRPIVGSPKPFQVPLPSIGDILVQHSDPTYLHSYTSQLTSVSQTGGTIHHHSTSPTRRMVPPLAAAALAGGSVTVPLPAQQMRRASSGTVAVPVGTSCVNSNLKPGAPTMANLLMNQSGPLAPTSPVVSPVQRPKRIKLEEKPPANEEIGKFRKMVCDHKIKMLNRNKENYVEHITELFFLQHSGNMMDFLSWKRRPSPQLVAYLKANVLDSDDEEQSMNTEVKVPIPGGTPVAISTTLPAAVTQLTQQGSAPIPGKPQGGRHGMVFGNHQPQTPSNPQPLVPGGTPLVPELQASALAKSPLPSSSHQTPPRIASSPHTPTGEPKLLTSTPVASTPRTSLAVTLSTSSVTTTMTPTSVKSHRLAMTSVSPVRLQTRQHSISAVYDSTIGSQEEIVERAKQEAFVVQRISELRKDGLWSEKRLPKVQEPARTKAHWDYLLEEMVWLATDFAQERKWKKAAAKKCAKMCQKYHQEQKLREERAEKEAELKLKRIASAVAKEIKQFWTNVEKLVEYKQQSRLEEKRKKALDLHLNFIVDQTEKYSSWLAQGINKSLLESTTTSIISSAHESRASSPARSNKSSSGNDADFEPNSSDSDDEETIAKEEEQGQEETDQANEVEMLQKDGEVPLEDLLETLPPEILEKPASPAPSDDGAEESDEKDSSALPDEEFRLSSDESVDDDEATMEEQEEVEGTTVDHTQELDELRQEGEMSLEDLLQKYTMGEQGSESMSSEGQTEEEQEESEEESEEEEVSSEAESVRTSEIGIESLLGPVTSDTSVKSIDQEADDGPTKEITDIAADAERFQPKGYTYSTAQVATTVPFLLKHQLREYQHIGLDWLVTMQERKLNGILADEMGLGKTIQTIALLAHLACEKGIWGPHLIVVPTSVMLNWEMECKKWCPAFKILTYYGTQKERKQKRQGWTKPNAFHICITSYKLVIQDHQSFRRKRWKYFILDEAQNIKNFKSQRWQLLLNFQSQWRLLLTGTPLQNSLMELWSLMHFLMPNVFQSHRDFKEWFANPLSGMIEGSHEYNESLIRRLHKVLRPFLLRRLKSEVEKQLPQKYEHVIMCRLSKRQRFLYDDFMSQAKTKETLANGNFMSVINVLMQLRKVCNHPNMFEPRPTISPFQMEGICFWTASLVNSIFEYNPYKHVNLYSLNLLLSDLELCLTAFAAHRIKRFQTPKKLIEEIDSAPDPPPKCPPGKIKLHVRTSTAASQNQSGRASPLVPAPHRAPSPAPLRTLTPVVSHVAGTQVKTILNAPTLNQQGIPVSVATTQPQQLSGYTFQLVQQQPQGLPVAQLTPTSTPITVQIQQTQQGPRITVPAGQLAQIPAGFAQIVQTSTGQHILLTSNPQAILQPVSAIQSTAASGVAITTQTASQLVGSTASPSTTSSINPTSATAATPAKSVAAVASTMNKPVLRVPPMNVVTTTSMTTANSVVATNNKPAVLPSPIKPVVRTESRLEEVKEEARLPSNYSKSLFFLDSIVEKKKELRAEKLHMLAKFNTRRCEACPIYGSDLIKALTVVEDVRPVRKSWQGMGYIHCMNAVKLRAHPCFYWYQSEALGNVIKTPEKCIQDLRDVMNRFVFLVPSVTAPRISFHTSHPSPSPFLAERQRDIRLQQALSPLTTILHPVSSAMATQFPDPRLIEYDCGKLQTLVYLLRRLKTDYHRVLIFTQMTRMLDVLEQFLNYHGHIYLRLDGTTRVEQRQALMERFNADKRIFCFILSTRSGGIGVNLTGADTVIFYDSDWNPTMDAQAQDRCHRIGQTRDVHIYRLVSMKSIEENILKKANQKRLLGEVAIEGGNFTTAFFRKNTIHDLFDVDYADNKKLEEVVVKKEEPERNVASAEAITTVQLENALANAEEDMDVQATKTAKAEAAAELAEFDESIPYDADGRGEEEFSKVEQEIGDLMSQLTPVERYAMVFLESIQEPFSLEQLKQAEEEIEAQKKDWELGRLQALKEEEEERRAQMEEDEVPFTYSREDANNQVHKSKKSKARVKVNNSSEATPGRRSTRISTSKRRSSSVRRHADDNCEEQEENKLNGDAEKNELSPPLTNHTGEKDEGDTLQGRMNNALLNVKGNSAEAINIIIPNDHGVKGRIGLRSPATSPKQGSLLSPRLSPASNSSNSNCGPQVSPQPFSNPNLVIRTRRASAREAQQSNTRHDSEGEIDVVSVCTEQPSANFIGVNSVADHSPLKSGSLTPDRMTRRVKAAQDGSLLDGDAAEV